MFNKGFTFIVAKIFWKNFEKVELASAIIVIATKKKNKRAKAKEKVKEKVNELKSYYN